MGYPFVSYANLQDYVGNAGDDSWMKHLPDGGGNSYHVDPLERSKEMCETAEEEERRKIQEVGSPCHSLMLPFHPFPTIPGAR